MDKEQVPLRFKPMTKGLGFHPFSDGLPYAPVSKSPQISSKRQTDATPTIIQPTLPKPPAKSRQVSIALPESMPPRPIAPQRLDPRHAGGTGAVSAGAPTFVFPQAKPATGASRQTPQKKTVPSQSPSVAEPPLTKAKASLDQPGLVYLLKRVSAFWLDTAINLALCATAFGAVLWKLEVPLERLASQEVVLGSALFFVAFNWALVTAQEIAFKTSLGKRAFGLTLEGVSTSALFLRSFFFLFSTGFLAMGILWALVDKRKRCWHDLFTDAAPREIARL